MGSGKSLNQNSATNSTSSLNQMAVSSSTAYQQNKHPIIININHNNNATITIANDNSSASTANHLNDREEFPFESDTNRLMAGNNDEMPLD
jgi:hypothetical protein